MLRIYMNLSEWRHQLCFHLCGPGGGLTRDGHKAHGQDVLPALGPGQEDEAEECLLQIKVPRRFYQVAIGIKMYHFYQAKNNFRKQIEFPTFYMIMNQPKFQLVTFKVWSGRWSDISYYIILSSHRLPRLGHGGNNLQDLAQWLSHLHFTLGRGQLGAGGGGEAREATWLQSGRTWRTGA